MRGNVEVICPTTQVFYLRQTGTTGNSRMAVMLIRLSIAA
jgi:hypothetical protein